MRKNQASKTKKTGSVKEGQKISSFFNKLTVVKPKEVTGTNTASNNDNFQQVEEPNKTSKSSNKRASSSKKNSCTAPAAVKTQATSTRAASKKKSSVANNKKTSLTSPEASKPSNSALSVPKLQDKDIETISNSSDNDFVSVKKEKVASNLLVAFKTKHKYIYEKNVQTANQIETSNKKSDNNSKTSPVVHNIKESQLVIDLDSSVKKTSPVIDHLFGKTPEKTYLQNDEVLLDITHSSNKSKPRKSLEVLFTNITFKRSERKNSPPHSTPYDCSKKRKFPLDSPDIIPPTPQDINASVKNHRSTTKAKICIENKFTNMKDPSLNGKYVNDEPVVPDMIVKSPPKKKRRSSECENRKVIHLMDISSTEFEKIHSLSIKLCSSSEKSTPKDIGSSLKDNKNSSTVPCQLELVVKSNEKVRSPGKHNAKVQNCEISNKLSALETEQNTANKNKQMSIEERNELVDYFANLPSSNEEKKCVELDKSNFIVTKKSPKTDIAPQKENIANIIEDLDFDDDWDEQLNNVEDKIDSLNLESWQYCKILEVTKDIYQNLTVKLESVESKKQTSCILQGVWQFCKLKPGDLVNIEASKSSGDVPFSINNNSGFLVFEPDIMISPTSIVGAQFCKRKGILADKFRGFDSENKVMIVGTLVHRLLQDVLKKKIYSRPMIEKTLMRILSTKEIMTTSFSTQIPIEELKNELMPFIPKIINFINKYIETDIKKKQSKNQSEDWQGVIHSIQDIEENIWCPQLGVKGKIDVTIKTKPLEAILPLELKTGRASMSLEHRGQVILYAMIMTELGYTVSSGLLLYLREDAMKEVKASHREKRDLLMLRNEVAYFMKQGPSVPGDRADKDLESSSQASSKSSLTVQSETDPLKQLLPAELPEPINHHSACPKCPYALICTAFLSRDTSYELSDSHPLKPVSTEQLAHLERSHIDYFIHWTSLLTLENNYKPPMKELKDIWRLLPYQRELRGKSLCHLKLSKSVTESDDSYVHSFVRISDDSVSKLVDEKGLKNDFLMSGLGVGNYVVVSTDARVAVAAGFIKDLTESEVTVSLERNLSERYSTKTLHLDTYESQQILNFSMTSVAALMDSTDRAKRLRELIIDRKPSIITGKLSKSIMTTGANILRRLNKIQQRAVLNALTIKDYLLIKGMPGTGKTATIVALIQLLVELNKTVLITSHTHSAVDNVCLRLLDCGVDILRLGSESRVHPSLKHRTESALTAHCKTVDELKQVYDNARVVAVTCLAAGHPMFSHRTLDVCIVDESTQVLQCTVVKALLATTTFVLIGDPDQLPPVVRNPEAVCRGMNESLFERLDAPKSTITLTLQYRMNKVITDLANAVTYRGQLLCADDSIGYAILRLPKLERLQCLYNQEQWILNTLDTKIQNSVTALNTGPTWNIKLGKVNSSDENLLSEVQVPPQNVAEDEERSCRNKFEAAIVVSILEALKEGGVLSSCIGVIAPYRAQVSLLKKLVSKIYEKENCETVEVNTVDQYQGRDKDVIIYSCTRSRDTSKQKMSSSFEILEDKRRLTVAITRAKHKLIVIGDFATLKDYTPFAKLLSSLSDCQKTVLQDNVNGFKWEKVLQRVEK